LDRAPETEKKFFQRLRDMTKIKDCKAKTERGFRGFRLKTVGEARLDGQARLYVEADETQAAHGLERKIECTKTENNLADSKIDALTVPTAPKIESIADCGPSRWFGFCPAAGNPVRAPI
jgi:hypothetical protein